MELLDKLTRNAEEMCEGFKRLKQTIESFEIRNTVAPNKEEKKAPKKPVIEYITMEGMGDEDNPDSESYLIALGRTLPDENEKDEEVKEFNKYTERYFDAMENLFQETLTGSVFVTDGRTKDDVLRMKNRWEDEADEKDLIFTYGCFSFDDQPVDLEDLKEWVEDMENLKRPSTYRTYDDVCCILGL